MLTSSSDEQNKDKRPHGCWVILLMKDFTYSPGFYSKVALFFSFFFPAEDTSHCYLWPIHTEIGSRYWKGVFFFIYLFILFIFGQIVGLQLHVQSFKSYCVFTVSRCAWKYKKTPHVLQTQWSGIALYSISLYKYESYSLSLAWLQLSRWPLSQPQSHQCDKQSDMSLLWIS